MFGQQQSSGLFSNVSSAPTFGPTTTAAGTSLFGTQPATSGGLFGAAKPVGSLFGTTTTQQSGSLFGQQSSTSTAFGSGGGLFGTNKPATSAFGQTTQSSLFGQPQQNTTGGLFGAQAPSTGAFGTATTTTTPSLFGGITQFGQQQPQTGGIFGPKPAQPPTFGSFGGSQQSTFGSSTGGSSLFGDVVKFSPPTGSDTMQLQGKPTPVSTKQMCISAMKEYENKSLDELRVADYLAGRKVNTNAPAGSTLFGQQNQPQSSGLFGSALSKPATGGLFSNTQTFVTTTTTGTTSLFGVQPATSSGLFGATKPAGSLFGTTTTQQSGSLFGQQPSTSTAFGSGGALFGVNKPATSAFGQTTQPSLFSQPTQSTTGLFGGPASSTGAFGTATTTTIPSLFGGITQFGQQQPQTGGIFGSKPAQPPTFGSFGGSQQPTFGSSTGGSSLFGVNAQKIGGGIFGAQPQPSQTGGGLFGSAGTGLMQKPAQSLFGSPQPAQPGTLFGGNTQQTFGSPSSGGGSSSIYLGSPNLNATIQQAIIDAQLSTLPYGDSPLLKSSVSPKKSHQDISRLQKQLELGASSRKIYDDKLLSPPTNGILSTTSNIQQEVSTKNSSALDLNGSLLDSSFGYKPMVLLPSVGFGAALGLHQSPKLIKSKGSEKSLSDKSSFLNRTAAPNDENRIKSLDMSVVIEDEQHPSTPTQQFNVSQQTNETTSLFMPTRILPEENFPQPIFEKISETSQQTPQQQQQQPQQNISQTVTTTTTTTSSSPPSKKYRIKLTHPEYYTEPTLDELEELFSADGICQLEGGLTVGRLGYGSVFWKGPIELREPLDLDEIVHFRNKEVIVYPDDSTKPEIGCGLNKQAEVSLERIWPINPKTKQIIKNPDELRRMGFREKLERLCQRMDATFRDYQPMTGTWSFEVQHFSKYGFLEDNEDEQTMGETGTSQAESDALKRQAHNRALVQNAKVPLREIQKSLEGIGRMQKNVTTSSSQFSNAKRIFPEHQLEKHLTEGDEGMHFDSKDIMDFNEDSKLFQDEIIRKKFKFDDTLFDSKKLLERIAEKEEKTIARRQSKLVERSPKNVFKGLSALNISKSNSLLAKVGIQLDRRSCRIGFSQGLLFTGLNEGSHENTIKIEKATVIPTIKNYFTQFIHSKQGIEVQKLLEQLENSELIHFNPPSPLFNYLDKFVVTSFANGKLEEIEKAIYEICSILLTNSESIEEKITQRIQMGNWLRAQLAISNRPQRNTIFGHIFHYLINGSIDSAIKLARQTHHYNLALLLSLFKSPISRMIREQAAKQLNSMNRRNSDPDYVRIFELISGEWTKTKGGCLEELDWLQTLGILIWYHSSPTTTLIECTDALEDLMKK